MQQWLRRELKAWRSCDAAGLCTGLLALATFALVWFTCREALASGGGGLPFDTMLGRLKSSATGSLAPVVGLGGLIYTGGTVMKHGFDGFSDTAARIGVGVSIVGGGVTIWDMVNTSGAIL